MGYERGEEDFGVYVIDTRVPGPSWDRIRDVDVQAQDSKNQISTCAHFSAISVCFIVLSSLILESHTLSH